MTREQAIAAYRRVAEWERRASAKLAEEILIPFFGQCGCRLHNCKVNYENGVQESDVVIGGVIYTHHQLYKLAKKFDHDQANIWKTAKGLQAGFARHF